jgi:hypothetical protein
MEIIKLNNNEYVQADYILSKALVYSKGIRTGKELIKKHNIDNTNYIFGRKNKENQWIQTEGKSLKFDKVLFLLNFVNTINEIKEEDASIAPPIIKLKDEEKFYDDEGNFINIEVRGVKEVDKIYFKVKDVAKGFNMKMLQDTLIDSRNGYTEKHYKYFNCKKSVRHKENSNKETIKKTLFLTYEGILRVLFVSKNNKTSKFISWATKTLFTLQMGTKEEKQKLFDKVLGNDIESSRNAIKCNTNKISSIYLLTLGYVKDLRKEMNISDNFSDEDIVCKYGFTDNLDRRLMEHKNNFSKIENVDLKLKYYTFIDYKELSKAENNMKNIFNFNNSIIQYQDYKELVVLSKKNLEYIKEEYEKCRRLFNGNQEDNLKHIDFLKNQIDKLTLQLIIKDKDIENLQEKLNNEIKNREIEIKNIIRDYKHQLNNKDKDNFIELTQYKHQIEILNKDIENLKLKISRKSSK